ncbi:MAG: Uma2 family endonuclease [Myxococcaceae bacterium]|nr:MAG: Uma2 family endonuclease [Myxococcaceae bacterium]
MTSTARRVHTVHYPETDHMGEDFLQRAIAEALRPLIARWFKSRRVKAFTGADQFLYWVEGDPTRRVAPDVYVLPKVDPDAVPTSWKLWEVGPPSFALEIVSRDVGKDYEDAPAEYAAMGAKELVLFDPGATARSRTRVRWQVYRRLARRGFVRVAQSSSDRVEVASLGCWLRAIGEGRDARLRLGIGIDGEELFMTEAEAANARADSAEAEVARLRALLAGRG